MINHDIDNPGQFVLPKERHIGRNIALGVGSVALATVLANSFQSDPRFDIQNNAQLVAPVTLEHSPIIDQEYTGPVLPETIQQDEITGLVVQRETLEFAEKYDIELKEGQSGANYLSAKGIEDAVRQATGGSVQPGTVIETRVDPETGFVVSTYTPEKSE